MVLRTPEGDKIECMIYLDFPTTNNEVEYKTLVAGLDLVRVAELKTWSYTATPKSSPVRLMVTMNARTKE